MDDASERELLESFQETRRYRSLLSRFSTTRNHITVRSGGYNLEFDHIIITGSSAVLIEVKYLNHDATGITASTRRTKKRKEVKNQIFERVDYLKENPQAFGQQTYITEVEGYTLTNNADDDFEFSFPSRAGHTHQEVIPRIFAEEADQTESLGWALAPIVATGAAMVLYNMVKKKKENEDSWW
eukprot:TRINITY_DN12695_c0_g1_i1.p1 TRINITY_DN12695_c0_g1~~TRINITY_DN12695_c0_g1_i1.p1  ORF type:complete len:184 (-),score=43.00 TRINITY_DN12695_c0_g1_i1:23-574(-)